MKSPSERERPVESVPDSWLKTALRPTADCAEPGTWHSLVLGDLPPAAAEALQDHAKTCAACRAELRLAEEFERDDRVADLQVERLKRRVQAATAPLLGTEKAVRPWSRHLLPLAAGVLAVAAASLWLSIEQPPEISSPGTGRVVRSQELVLTTPEPELSAPPSAFEWLPLEAATTYRVSVSRVDGTVVWSEETAGAPLVLTESAMNALEPFVRYEWRVEAVDAEGRSLAASQSHFTFRP